MAMFTVCGFWGAAFLAQPTAIKAMASAKIIIARLNRDAFGANTLFFISSIINLFVPLRKKKLYRIKITVYNIGMRNDKIAGNVSAVLAAVVMVFAIVCSLVVFQRKMMDLLSGMTLQNISEMQELYAETLRSKLNDQFKALEAQTEYFYEIDLLNSEAVKQKARSVIAAGDFVRIAVVNEDGSAIDYSGKNLPNMKNKEYFSAALRKNTWQISNKIELDERLSPCLTITVPFKTRKGQRGVVAGFLSYDIMRKIFSIPIFDGQSYFYLVSGDGNILLFNKDKQKTLYNIDIYEYIDRASQFDNPQLANLKVDMIKGQAGYITLDGVEGQKLFSYAPLKIKDWFIISALPYSYIKNQQTKISALVYVLLSAVTLAILVFFGIVYAIEKKNLEIKRDNERLTIANKQAQTLIFEYNLQTHAVDFSGDTNFLLGTDKKRFSVEFVRAEYFSRVHPEDRKTVERFREAIRNGCKNFSAEFRYKSFSNNYFWVKITGSAILDDKNCVAQFIGSVTNVNSQVLHEQELRSMADSDKLSSLWNKAAFERKTREYFARDAGERKSALIIIDLDNFKEVNDNLGHLTGDLAIKDAAKKISLIFSERDFMGRFGGDEFCVLMRFDAAMEKDAILKIVNAKAADLNRSLREEYFNDEQSISVTASVGIAIYPYNGGSYEELFRNADHALYDVKQRGKDNYKIYG